MLNLFSPSKKTLILIAVLVLLIIISALISLLTPNQPTETTQPVRSPKPSQLVTNNFPSSSPLPEPSSNLAYSPEILKQDYERLNANIPLSQPDSDIRTRLISSLNNQSGFLNQTSNYNIKYIKTRNIFMVEILSENADEAKSQALNWFKSQGLTTQGICNLPVSIYLTLEIKNLYESQNKTFNPIPEGCQ